MHDCGSGTEGVYWYEFGGKYYLQGWTFQVSDMSKTLNGSNPALMYKDMGCNCWGRDGKM